MEVRVREAYPGRWLLQMRMAAPDSWVGVTLAYDFNTLLNRRVVTAVEYYSSPQLQLQHAEYLSKHQAEIALADYKYYLGVIDRITGE